MQNVERLERVGNNSSRSGGGGGGRGRESSERRVSTLVQCLQVPYAECRATREGAVICPVLNGCFV